jgi:hypothetical protein
VPRVAESSLRLHPSLYRLAALARQLVSRTKGIAPSTVRGKANTERNEKTAGDSIYDDPHTRIALKESPQARCSERQHQTPQRSCCNKRYAEG